MIFHTLIFILQVIEETKAPHSIFMVMEYVEGGNSMTMVKNENLEADYVPSFICSRSDTVMGVSLMCKDLACYLL